MSIPLITLLIFFGSVVKSESVDYSVENAYRHRTEQSCYNYTFIDNSSIRGTLLEKELIDSSPGKPDFVSYDAVLSVCKPDNAVQLAVIDKPGTLDIQTDDAARSSGDTPLLPNPQIQFVEEDKVNYDQFQSRNTIFYGGLVPFVAVPDSDLVTEDHFFNPNSFSLFLYFKKKF